MQRQMTLSFVVCIARALLCLMIRYITYLEVLRVFLLLM